MTTAVSTNSRGRSTNSSRDNQRMKRQRDHQKRGRKSVRGAIGWIEKELIGRNRGGKSWTSSTILIIVDPVHESGQHACRGGVNMVVFGSAWQGNRGPVHDFAYSWTGSTIPLPYFWNFFSPDPISLNIYSKKTSF